jgi:hypothetical protein
MDAVNNIPHTIENDSDFEVENELPSLESIYPKDVYKKLRPKDRKRLEVINGKICFIFFIQDMAIFVSRGIFVKLFLAHLS